MKTKQCKWMMLLAIILTAITFTACGGDDKDDGGYNDNGSPGSGYIQVTCSTCYGNGNCRQCKGTGKSCFFCNDTGNCTRCEGNCKCYWCKGDGRYQCTTCKGSHICRTCDGSGTVHGFSSYWTCTSCKGSGECIWCDKDGLCDCSVCNKTGNCPECNGSGNCKECGGDALCQLCTNGDGRCKDCEGKGYVWELSGNSSSGNGSSGDDSRKCQTCGGSGKCSNVLSRNNLKLYCQGSRICKPCGGTGQLHDFGMYHRCTYCNKKINDDLGNGECGFCDGTGDCENCNGKGYK